MKRQWKFVVVFLLLLIVFAIVVTLIRRLPLVTERYIEQPPVYIILPSLGSESGKEERTGQIKSDDIVFNQGAPLKLPYEFIVSNPYLTVDQIKEIANEILPASSLHNFVVIK
jgi:hypothetical protein